MNVPVYITHLYLLSTMTTSPLFLTMGHSLWPIRFQVANFAAGDRLGNNHNQNNILLHHSIDVHLTLTQFELLLFGSIFLYLSTAFSRWNQDTYLKVAMQSNARFFFLRIFVCVVFGEQSNQNWTKNRCKQDTNFWCVHNCCALHQSL